MLNPFGMQATVDELKTKVSELTDPNAVTRVE